MKHGRVRPPPIDRGTLEDPPPRTQPRAQRWAKTLGMSNRAGFSFPLLLHENTIFHLHTLARRPGPPPPLCDFFFRASSTTPAATLQREAGRRRTQLLRLLKIAWITAQSEVETALTAALERHERWVRDGEDWLRTTPITTNTANTKTPATTPLPDRCGVVSWVAEENAMCAATWPIGRGVLGAWQHARK